MFGFGIKYVCRFLWAPLLFIYNYFGFLLRDIYFNLISIFSIKVKENINEEQTNEKELL